MTKILELILEKESDLQPGTNFHLVKVDGKKLIVEVREESQQKPYNPDEGKRELDDILAGYPGGQFTSAEEVRKYIKEERDSWDS